MKRPGDENVKCTLLLLLDYQPMQFKLDSRLARLLGIHTATRPTVISALWNYIKDHKLQVRPCWSIPSFHTVLVELRSTFLLQNSVLIDLPSSHSSKSRSRDFALIFSDFISSELSSSIVELQSLSLSPSFSPPL